MSDMVGITINDRYRVDGILGRGGYGVTYYALDMQTNTYVALKELKGTITDDGIDRVSRLIGMNKITGIASVYDIFASGGVYYIVMEYIQGMNGAEYLSTYKDVLTEEQIMGLMQPVISGVAYLNSLGIVHGDIGTDNIVVDMNGYGVLIDLPVNDGEMQVKQGFSPIELYYNPPMKTAATDVYGISATLYHMLTGQVPTDAYQVNSGMRINDIRGMREGISPKLASCIMKGLSYDAAGRYGDAGMLYNALYAQNTDALHQGNVSSDRPLPKNGTRSDGGYTADASMRTYDPRAHKETAASKGEADGKHSGSAVKAAKKKRILRAFGIVAALLVVLGISITVYVVSNNKKEDDKSSEEQASEDQEEYEKNMELYTDALTELNNPSSWDAVDDAVQTLMDLGDFEDSKAKLFEAANEFMDEYDEYDRALNIYEYLGEDTDEDGRSGNEWYTECNFQKAVYYYNNGEYKAAKEIFDDLDPYTSFVNTDVDTAVYLDECNYQVALSDVSNGNTAGYEDAETIFRDRGDYDALSDLAYNYYNAGDYDKAEELFLELTNSTGNNYEEEIHNCQNAANLDAKYASYDAGGSTIYDSGSGTVNSYVDRETAENYLEYLYGSFTASDGVGIEISQIELNGQKYGIKKIDIDTRNSTCITVSFYYLNDSDTEHTMVYQEDAEYTVQYEDGQTDTRTHTEISVDGISYAEYWD